MRYVTPAILLLVVSATAQQSGGLERLAWLGGYWSGEVRGTFQEECWLPPANGVMPGVHRDSAHGKKAFFEYLYIEEREGKIAYCASPRGGAITPFALEKLGPRRVVFANPEHDFPQRIIYTLSEDGEALCARIEGPRGGKLRGIEWTWRRSELGGADPAVRAPAGQDPRLEGLAWMSGYWKGEWSPLSLRLEECWLPLRGGMLIGLHRELHSGGVPRFTFMRIQSEENGPALYWLVARAPSSLRGIPLSSRGGEGAVFEDAGERERLHLEYARIEEGKVLRKCTQVLSAEGAVVFNRAWRGRRAELGVGAREGERSRR